MGEKGHSRQRQVSGGVRSHGIAARELRIVQGFARIRYGICNGKWGKRSGERRKVVLKQNPDHFVTPPASLTSSTPTLPLAHAAPATLSFFLLLDVPSSFPPQGLCTCCAPAWNAQIFEWHTPHLQVSEPGRLL